MARRANISLSDEDDEENEGSHSGQADQRPRRVNNAGSLSPSPGASFSSDKENRTVTENNRRPVSGKSRAMPPPKTPMQNSDDGSSRASKRPRLSERGVPNASQLAHNARLEQTGDKNRYDPDQTMEERRAVRKGIRDLSRELTGTSHFNSLERPWLNFNEQILAPNI